MPIHELKLGDKLYTVASPLKFKQLRLVEPLMSKIKEAYSGGEGSRDAFYDAIAGLIVAVVSDIDPTFDRAALDNTPTTSDELLAFYKEVAIATGLYVPATKAAEGEGQSASPNQPTP